MNPKILKFQKWYNQILGHTKLEEDGRWGPNTKTAYRVVRAAGGFRQFAKNFKGKAGRPTKKNKTSLLARWKWAYRNIHFYNTYIARNSPQYIMELPAERYKYTGLPQRDIEHARKAIAIIGQNGGYRKIKDMWKQKDQTGVAGMGPKKTKDRNKEEREFFRRTISIATQMFQANAPQIERAHKVLWPIAANVAAEIRKRQFPSWRAKYIAIDDAIKAKLKSSSTQIKQTMGK